MFELDLHKLFLYAKENIYILVWLFGALKAWLFLQFGFILLQPWNLRH